MVVTPLFETRGSILAGTAASALREVEATLEIASAAAPDDIERLVATAEQMCYVLEAVRNPHTIAMRVILNGTPVGSPAAYPTNQV